METFDRLPPWSAESEQAVLGCLIQDAKASLPSCLECLPDGPDSFYDLRHALIYRTILEASEEAGAPIDLILLHTQLRNQERLEKVGGIAYVSSLADCLSSSANLPAYLEDLQSKLVLRKLIRTCTEIVGKAYSVCDTAELLDEAERDILAIRQKQHRKSPGIKELVRAAIGKIEDIWNRRGAIEGMATGFADLDALTGGLKAGELTVIAGYPGAGKTSFAMNLAEYALLSLQKKVGVFSLEMSAELLVTRFICTHARVNLRNVAKGFLSERDFPKLTNTAGRISGAAIWIEDDSDLSIYQFRAKARRLHQEHSIELLVVDYLQLLTAIGGSRRMENRQQEVSDISRGLKGTARELKIPVIALSQLNDEGKLRESRAIGQDADNVWRLKPEHQDEDEGEDDSASRDVESVDLEILKARNGPRGKISLTFLKSYTKFESSARISSEDMPGQNNQPHNDK